MTTRAFVFAVLSLYLRAQPPRVEIKTVPSKVFLTYKQAIRSLDEVGPIEWSVTPKMKRVLKGLGYDPLPAFELHVFFEGENTGDLDAARYLARSLELAASVDKIPDDDGRFSHRISPPYKCLSLIFTGSPLDSSIHWATLYQEAKARKLAIAKENREIALDRNGHDASAYVTELQLGIK